MVLEARKSLAWATAAAAIASAALLAASGGILPPRTASIVSDVVRGRPVGGARTQSTAPAGTTSAVPATAVP